MRRFIVAAAVGLGLLAASPLPSSSEVLSVFGEDIDATCSGTCSQDTTAGHFRSAWSRRGTTMTGTSNWITIESFAGQDTIWVHAQNYATNGNVSDNAEIIRILDTTGVSAVQMRGVGATDDVKFTKKSTGGVYTDLVTCPDGFPLNATLTQIDIKLVYAVAGSIDLYLNGSGTPFCSYSGDVTTDGRTQVGGATFGGFLNTTGTSVWSEIIVATTDTRAMGLLTIPPIANGNAMQWGGTNPCSDILDVTSANDASFISSTANDQLAQCTINPVIPAGTWGVEALAMSARVKRAGTGPQNMKFVTRSAGTDYFSSDFSPGTSFTNLRGYIQSVNPATSSPFTTGELTTPGFNIGISSEP